MYSRRFYSSQRAKNTPVIQTVTPKKQSASPSAPLPSDTRPRWATDFFENEFFREEKFYVEPRDFAPAVSFEGDANDVRAVSDAPVFTDACEEATTVSADESAAEDFGEKMKNMTFEDMMLTWLAMLGSSGDYDDEIFIILGLILMIGA